jgi:hypothetical protein
MTRTWLLPVVLVLLGSFAALAQDVSDAVPAKPAKPAPPAPPEKIKVIKEIVKPKERLSRRIFLCVDVSGSMILEGQVGKVLDAVKLILQQPLDDFELAIASFNDKAERWPGVKDASDNPKPVALGWTRLPSQVTIDAAEKWITDKPPFGGTEPDKALDIALHEKGGELSIILITDGGFEGPNVMSRISVWQEWRVRQNLGEAVIMTYGVGPDAEKAEGLLADIGRKWKGGFYVDDLKVPHVAPVDSKTRLPY